MPNVESWDLPVTETNRGEWLLTFTADTDEKLFAEKFRQTVVHTINGDHFPHYVWFEDERYAKLGRAVAEDEGALNLQLRHRTVTTVSTDWVDVP